MLKKLRELIDFEVISIQFVERDNLKFLEVELPDHDLETIEKKSRIISDLLDQIDDSDQMYYLDVFSSGTEKEIDLKNISLYVNEYISVKTQKTYLEKNVWEGNLIESGPNYLLIKVNNKGKFQKLKIVKGDILFIKTTAKIKKEK